MLACSTCACKDSTCARTGGRLRLPLGLEHPRQLPPLRLQLVQLAPLRLEKRHVPLRDVGLGEHLVLPTVVIVVAASPVIIHLACRRRKRAPSAVRR